MASPVQISGRSAPAASLQAKLVELDEQALTTAVIVPLLKAIGYSRVEYTNGPDEYGKDIVCWRADEFGEPELTVAQVKRFRPSRRAADRNSLSEIVTQLSQSLEKPLPNLDGIKHVPQIVYFITPYNIDTKVLESRFEAYAALRSRRVKILDGTRLSAAVLDKIPHIARQLLGTDFTISSVLAKHLTNEQLLQALRLSEGRNVATFFTDIDFTLDRGSTRVVLTAHFEPARRRMSLNEDEWKELKALSARCHAYFATSLLTTSPEEVDANHARALELIANWQPIMTAAADRVTDVDRRLFIHKRKLEQRERELNAKYPRIVELKRLLANTAAMAQADTTTTERLVAELERLQAPLKTLVAKQEQLYDELSICQRDRDEILAARPSDLYDVEVDGNALARSLLAKRLWVECEVQKFNSAPPSVAELEAFLRTVSDLFDRAGELLRASIIQDVLGLKPPRFTGSGERTRLSIPIHTIFDTGISVAVLGEAGAGKTTSLQMYAHRRLDSQSTRGLCIYVPLARASRATKTDSNPSARELRLEDFVAAYLNELGIAITGDALMVELGRSHGTLLLDGLDEAIKHVPRLLALIADFTKRYPTLQVITSTRVSGPYLDRLPFLGITLLPFTVEQQAKFVRLWFGPTGERHERRVTTHLAKNRDVAEVTRTPLLTTILCVLEEHGVPLPDNETRLYESRLELLLGVYDIHKQTSRITSSRQVLERVARRIAFRLHHEGRRDEEPDRMREFAWAVLQGEMTRAACDKAVDELFDPCNVLVPMTPDGRRGFGHLRYQEYLVALELKNNRSIDIVSLMRQTWWRGALVLFAQMNDSLEWLVNQLVEECLVSSVRETLHAMIERGPRRERVRHRDLIRRSLEADEQDAAFMARYEYQPATDEF